MSENTTVIVDLGSGMVKAGLSCDSLPTACFPSLVGKPREHFSEEELNKEFYVGDEIQEHIGKLTLRHPLDNGIINSFPQTEAIFNHIYYDRLHVDSAEHPLLLTEPPFNPRPNREMLVEMMFENFEVPSLNIQIQGVLALLGRGRTTGIVLDSGDGLTHTIPVFDGYCVPTAIKRMNLAGRELNVVLAKLLAQQGFSLTTSADSEQVRIMKEKFCFVAQKNEFQETQKKYYTLPDGRRIEIGDAQWKTPEVLFDPLRIGVEQVGIGQLIWNTIDSCGIDIRRNLVRNVLLSGGNTMFPGFAERVTTELKELAPLSTQSHVNVHAPEERNLAVWVGAHLLANLRNMDASRWLTKQDYYECGASIIHDTYEIRHA